MVREGVIKQATVARGGAGPKRDEVRGSRRRTGCYPTSLNVGNVEFGQRWPREKKRGLWPSGKEKSVGEGGDIWGVCSLSHTDTTKYKLRCTPIRGTRNKSWASGPSGQAQWKQVVGCLSNFVWWTSWGKRSEIVVATFLPHPPRSHPQATRDECARAHYTFRQLRPPGLNQAEAGFSLRGITLAKVRAESYIQSSEVIRRRHR